MNRMHYIPVRIQYITQRMKTDPSYGKRLMRMPEDDRKALLDGDWSVFAGQYFKEWSESIHVIEPFEIPSWWRRFRSLDYGLDMTACYWWAVSPEDQLYIYRELYEPDLSLSEAAKTIVEMTPANEKISYTVASPDLWNRRQDTGIAGVETRNTAGLNDLVRADHRRIPGWRALREALKPYDDPNGGLDPYTGGPRKTSRLRITREAPNLIRTLPGLVHDRRKVEDVSDGVEDHGPESVRYGIMSRPPKAGSLEERRKRQQERAKRTRPVVSSVTGY